MMTLFLGEKSVSESAAESYSEYTDPQATRGVVAALLRGVRPRRDAPAGDVLMLDASESFEGLVSSSTMM